MARGWESKAVESQLEEKGVRDAEYARRYEASPEVRARRERIESLRLSRARTLDQLERAATPAHREMLKRSLLAIEREVAELE